MGTGPMQKGLGRDELWQEKGMPRCLKGWEVVKVGMLEDQVSGGLPRTGLGREAVGPGMGKVIWGGPVHGLETWAENLGFYSVHTEELPEASELGIDTLETSVLGQLFHE